MWINCEKVISECMFPQGQANGLHVERDGLESPVAFLYISGGLAWPPAFVQTPTLEVVSVR